MIPYENSRKYGHYVGKDNRSRIFLILANGKRTTISYPKYLMEVKLGRYLEKNETVDHIDGDVTNNNITNLRVLDRSEHIKNDVIRVKSQKFICPICNKEFELENRKLHDARFNRISGKSGPFCSRSCAGKYGRKLQLNEIDKLPINNITVEYTTNHSYK